MSKIKFKINPVNKKDSPYFGMPFDGQGIVDLTLTLPDGTEYHKRTQDFPKTLTPDEALRGLTIEDKIEIYLEGWYAAYLAGKKVEEESKNHDLDKFMK